MFGRLFLGKYSWFYSLFLVGSFGLLHLGVFLIQLCFFKEDIFFHLEITLQLNDRMICKNQWGKHQLLGQNVDMLESYFQNSARI